MTVTPEVALSESFLTALATMPKPMCSDWPASSIAFSMRPA